MVDVYSNAACQCSDDRGYGKHARWTAQGWRCFFCNGILNTRKQITIMHAEPGFKPYTGVDEPKFTPEELKEIKKRYKDGEKISYLSQCYHASFNIIWNIVQKKDF